MKQKNAPRRLHRHNCSEQIVIWNKFKFFAGFTEDSVVAELLNLQVHKHKKFAESEKSVA